MRYWCTVLLSLCLFLSLPVLAQQELEILTLRHRPVDQILPALEPLLEPGASLSGMNNQIFLRASPRNRAEIRRALAAMDRPTRRLVIRITTDASVVDQQRGGGVSGSMGNDHLRVTQGGNGTQLSTRQGKNQANGWVYDTHSTRSGSSSQMVQTVDGGQAYIQVGRSVAVPLRQVVLGPDGVVATEAVVYRDIGQGFYAEPRVVGDRVTLEISQHADTPGRYGPGSANVQRLSTSVSGRLGEWMQLGGTGQEAEGRSRGELSLSTNALRETRSIWLRVEELP